MSVHARIKSSGNSEFFLGESDVGNSTGRAAIFEVKCGKTSERAVRESRERSAGQLFVDLESVASAVEGSDLGPTEDPFEPTTSCIYDTKKEATGNQIWSSET